MAELITLPDKDKKEFVSVFCSGLVDEKLWDLI